MNIKLKIIILVVAGMGVLLLCYYLLAYMSFSDALDKKYTREQLESNFKEHEKEFEELTQYFKSVIPQEKKKYSITFGRSTRNTVSLILYPKTISPENKIIGGSDLRMDAIELKKASDKLGWSSAIIKKLRDKLSKTNCDWIRTVEWRDDLLQIYPQQQGMGKFTYGVWDKPVVDSLTDEYGKPLSKIGFGNKVILDYTAAL
ncbi:MAG: hypothetical protein J0I41_00505 [Filimonas sp.]|nr:hypothetical protein [Filimonas sp.]